MNNFLQTDLWAMSPIGFAQLSKADEFMSNQQPEPGMMVKELRDMFSWVFNQRQEMVIADGVAIIDVRGGLMNDATPIMMAMGATGYDEIKADISAANASDAVNSILLNINSPGGHAAGIQEVVNAIQSSSKKVYAYCSGMACSAAYYLASATDAIFATDSATIGNVGTVLHWMDYSKLMDEMGIKPMTLTNEGAVLKGTFYESPMSEDQLSFLQDGVNELGTEFINFVKANRPDISEEVDKAGWYKSEKAGQLGFIDGIGSMSETLAIISGAI